jgi:hypothetical protein
MSGEYLGRHSPTAAPPRTLSTLRHSEQPEWRNKRRTDAISTIPIIPTSVWSRECRIWDWLRDRSGDRRRQTFWHGDRRADSVLFQTGHLRSGQCRQRLDDVLAVSFRG